MARRQQTTTTSPMAKQSTSPRLNGLRLQPEHMVRQTSFQQTVAGMENDPAHHLAGPFLPQTPVDAPTPVRVASPPFPRTKPSFWTDLRTGQWIVNPESSFKVLLLPIVLFCAWEAVGPTLAPGVPNPFATLIFISYPAPTSTPSDPRYMKGYGDLVFVAYYLVVWSFIRQTILTQIAVPHSRRFGIKKRAKVERFGEQLYALLYFGIFGAWGVRIMGQLPTWWYQTDMIWREYPHWDMQPELKRYYLMHAAYWCQQLLVMATGLEKPRKDFNELIAHHLVTLWMIGWSYLVNVTRFGNAVYLSMDVPDAFLATVKLLNYMRFETSKTFAFVVFVPTWLYFRVYQNVRMLRSLLTEFDLIPPETKFWNPPTGAWMAPWMRWQMFTPLGLLLCLNLFWTYLIFRIIKRTIFAGADGVDDDRSDDEGDDEEAENPAKKVKSQ